MASVWKRRSAIFIHWIESTKLTFYLFCRTLTLSFCSLRGVKRISKTPSSGSFPTVSFWRGPKLLTPNLCAWSTVCLIQTVESTLICCFLRNGTLKSLEAWGQSNSVSSPDCELPLLTMYYTTNSLDGKIAFITNWLGRGGKHVIKTFSILFTFATSYMNKVFDLFHVIIWDNVISKGFLIEHVTLQGATRSKSHDFSNRIPILENWITQAVAIITDLRGGNTVLPAHKFVGNAFGESNSMCPLTCLGVHSI